MTWRGKPIARWLNVQMSNWEQGRLGGKRSKIKKDLERQPRLKGVNTSECACVYVCFNAKKSSFQHARGRWVQCWGREPSRLVGCAGQEEVEMCFGLPISVGTQGKSEKKKDGKMWEKIIWVGKTGEAKYPWLHEILMHWRDAAGSPGGDTRVHGEMGTTRNRHGQPRLCFRSTEKILLLHFHFDFFPLCCLHWQGWLFFLLNLAASVWLRRRLSEREKAK